MCTKCAKDFTLADNGECEAKIENCRVKLAGVLSCKLCNDGYHKDLLSSLCTANSANCEIQDDDSAQCLVCKKGFMLNTTDNSCSKAPSFDDCEKVVDDKCE